MLGGFISKVFNNAFLNNVQGIILRYDVIVAHYGEVTLKRGKRAAFERLLARNLADVTGKRVERIQGRLIVLLDDSQELDSLLEKVRRVFGIVWYAPAIHVRGDYSELEKRVVEALREIMPGSFKIEARRSDKSFPLTSIELSRRLGKRVVSELGLHVDLKNPERVVFVEVTEGGFYVSFEKLRGLGGLPVGASGRVLALLSGGIDSPVAAWLMMKRGCLVDLLHFYALPPSDVKASKIPEIARLLSEYGMRIRLHLAPFESFRLRGVEMPLRMRLVMFRAYMLKVAEHLAERENYLGIVTGDSLGQVASQTLENLRAISALIKIPVYRPLLGFDKQEITDLAKRIGTYDLSIKEYIDCCAIVARHPETRARPEKVEEFWRRFGMDEAVEETLNGIETLEFKLGEEV